jgi:hypothetical protein
MWRLILGIFATLGVVACGNSPADPGNGQVHNGKTDVAGETVCPVPNNDPEEILAAIDNADSCFTASGLAQVCAWGSSVDVGFARSAMNICESGFASMTEADQQSYEYLQKACSKKFEDEVGTMYLSMNSYCHLEVTKAFHLFYPAPSHESAAAPAAESVVAFSKECPVSSMETDSIEKAINEATSCYQASEIAEGCAFGSSIDVAFCSGAIGICEKSMGELSAADRVLYDDLTQRCIKMHEGEAGSMYQSMSAFCQLQVARTFKTVFSALEM